MSNSEFDPEFWTLLQTIAIFVLGCWLIDTGLDWNTTFVIIKTDEALGWVHVFPKILVLLVGVTVILRTRKS
ncbi:MAG: hypothetical protein OSB09_08040 [Planctomycetota bacterium]|nr:hypothetical protein [Planctomycetota bacterium]